MTTLFKKPLLIFIASLLGVFASGAMAQTVTLVTGNTYSYFDGTNTSLYEISTASYSAGNPGATTSNNPWWSSSTTAGLFATAVNTSLGSTVNAFNFGPSFQFSDTAGVAYRGTSPIGAQTLDIPSTSSAVFAVATGVPEIDGALAPKVGFLLACLFLMFGRNRQDLAPALTA